MCNHGAREDHYFFGVLHACAHEVWASRMENRHGVGNDPAYHVERCFETFPQPWTPGAEPWQDVRLQPIAEAALALDETRNR